MSEARVNNLSNESNTGGPTISGITTFSGTNYFVPPVGNTAQRPENPQKGAIRFNTDSKHLEYYRGDNLGWVEVEASHDQLGGGYRGLWAGGDTPTIDNVIQYITIATLGNAIDFGDLVAVKSNHFCASSRTTVAWAGGYDGPNRTNSISTQVFSSLGNSVDTADLSAATSTATGVSNQTRACFIGGNDGSVRNTIEYYTFAAEANTSDFGDTTANMYTGSACGSSTRGVFNYGVTSAPARVNTINYITIATLGNSLDFGDLTTDRNGTGALSNSTRGVWGGGETPSSVDTMDYVTLATLGNAVDFGNMVGNRHNSTEDGASSPTRGVWAGGQTPNRQNVIQYITCLLYTSPSPRDS